MREAVGNLTIPIPYWSATSTVPYPWLARVSSFAESRNVEGHFAAIHIA